MTTFSFLYRSKIYRSFFRIDKLDIKIEIIDLIYMILYLKFVEILLAGYVNKINNY
jgi:hypothetical protein